MPVVSRSVLVAHPAGKMYALVADVEAYPEFLPWCSGAQVHHRDAVRTRATLQISYRGVRQRFTTENVLHEPGRMGIALVDGPFRRLEGEWRFTALGAQGCKVELKLDYEFSSRLLAGVVGPVFEHIAGTLVEAFVRRADAVGASRGWVA